MALPTIFGVITDLIGITVGACSNQPHVDDNLSERIKANTAYMRSSREYVHINYKVLEQMMDDFQQKLDKSGLRGTNHAEACRISNEIIRRNYIYLEDYFARKFHNLK